MDLKKFILPKKFDNTDEKQVLGDMHFDTTDLIFLDDKAEVACGQTNEQRRSRMTDWAKVNGAKFEPHNFCCSYWLRSAYSYYSAHIIDNDGLATAKYVEDCNLTVRPSLQLDISAVVSERMNSRDNFKIRTVKDSSGNELYHMIEFGEYPKSYVGDTENSIIEDSFLNFSNTEFKPTGKKYTGRINKDNKIVYYDEYEYKGQKYVRAKVFSYRDGFYSDGSKIKDCSWVWIKVEPITWQIRNWDELPMVLNPKGNNTASFINVRTEEGIATLPFYPNNFDEYRSMWQNSTIRGYLNGINVNNITSNGNVNYGAPNGGDFTEQSFLNEALTFAPTAVATQQTEDVFHSVVDRLKRKGYGIKVQETPMSVKDQIRFYIDNGKSFMLHGPSGIGKTRRIEEADPDFVSIVLRNGILPEEVIGKTIYPNNDKTQAGTWVPPAWYADLCEKCEREPDKQHVLFIDEITNVKPSEQSLVFHLVLNNSIGPNIGPLPENAVVVAAGNSKEESDAAYNMPEPLFRRFDGHIELKPDIQLWLEWGSEPSVEDESRPKVHPLVANFVGTYGSNVFYSPYDSEEPPKFAIDPRGWEQVSDIIYDNNGLIAKELIENKVGNEIATTFIAFAKNPPVMLEDVLEGNYDYNDIPDAFDAKYALALSLRNASINEIEKVREFVRIELGAEILAMFDVAWVGNDNEKAIYLEELSKPKETQDSVDVSEDNLSEVSDVADREISDVDKSMLSVASFMKRFQKIVSKFQDKDLSL